MIKITIITICLNAEKTLRKTIESVLNQKSEEVEYILVDGGSDDSTLSIIDSYKNQIDLTIKDVNGICESFNCAIQQAKGQWIGILNADDWYEENTIEIILNTIKTVNNGVICGKQIFLSNSNEYYVSNSVPDQITREMTINHIGSFVAKATYEEFGDFDADFRYAMDYEIYYRFYCKKVSFLVIDAVLATMTAGGVSDGNWYKALLEIKKAKKTTQSYWKRNSVHLFLTLRMATSRRLQKIGLKKLVSLYRKKYARIKKI